MANCQTEDSKLRNSVEDDSDTEEEEVDEFTAATNYLPQLIAKTRVSDNDLIYLYARFKQANLGPCNTKRPGFLEFSLRKKWDAWNSVKEMSQDDAKIDYIRKLKELDPKWEFTKDSIRTTKTGTSWVSVSTMAAHVDVVPDDQKTVYDWCQQGDVNFIDEFLTKSHSEIDAKDEQGLSLLHWACDRGHIDIVRLLIRQKSNIDITDHEGQTPLHYACSCGYADIVQLLLDNNADLEIKDEDGMTATDMVDDAAVELLLASWSSQKGIGAPS